MDGRHSDRVFAAFGVAYVAISLAAVGIGSDLYGGPGVGSSDAKVAAAIAHPVAPHNWVGAYLAMLAVGCFLAFSMWAVGKLGDGTVAHVARAAAVAYAAVLVVSLGVLDAMGYRQGHDLTVSAARSLDAVDKATYVGTWFLTAFFLLAVGGLALVAARRALGWATVGLGVATLVVTPWTNSLGEIAVLAFFAWIVVSSIALARGGNEVTRAVVYPQHA